MTNLNNATIGFNHFCGPAVLSILTGKNTDECAAVITGITGNYKVKGVMRLDLLEAASRLGFANQPIETISNSLFGAISELIHKDGIYIVTVTGHFVVIEINDKKAYFCDNHTKEPIRAEASARLSMKVVAINRVYPKPASIFISNEMRVTRDSNRISTTKVMTYNDHQDIVNIGNLYFSGQSEIDEFINKLIELKDDDGKI